VQITNAFLKKGSNYISCIYFGLTLVQIDYSHLMNII